MFRSYALRSVLSARAFATAKVAKVRKPFLADAVAKAAIGKNVEVASSFVGAFAGVVHGKQVSISEVSLLPETTNLSISRDMKHDIALRYSVGDAETAVIEVVPQHYSRALVEIQRQSEKYLPARSLAHASGHFLAAINDEAKAVKARRMAAEAKKNILGDGEAGQPRRRSKSKAVYDSDVYTAYLRVEPVHLLMLSDFCYVYDTADKVWRANKSPSALAGGRYGWASPLFSTFRLTSNAENIQLFPDVEDPGPNTFATTLQDRLSITLVHLPLVPMNLEDDGAWGKVATLPEHKQALKSAELRQWLHYLAHTTIVDDKVNMPAELRAHPIFSKSAESAEALLGSPHFYFSEKDMAYEQAAAAEEKEKAVAETQVKERTVAAEMLGKAVAVAADERKKAVAETQVKERTAAAEALGKAVAVAADEQIKAVAEMQVKERAAAAEALGKALAEERAAAAERVAALTAKFERLNPGSGAS